MLNRVKFLVIGLVFLTGGLLFASEKTALDIIKVLDSYDPDTQSSTMDMIIENNGRTYTNQIKEWKEGNTKIRYEFVGLEQSGDQFLQIGTKAWLYSADMEEVIPMSKHMLRESAFGSDMTFEELAEGITFERRYSGELLADDPEYPESYILELKAKKKTESVQKKIIYVNKDGLFAEKVLDYAPSGALLKETTVLERRNINGYIVPIKLIIKDSFKKGSVTTITWNDLVINAPINKSVFSLSRFGE